MIDATLACEDVNLRLYEVVTVADVDAEKRVDDSLVQIWKLKFGHKTKGAHPCTSSSEQGGGKRVLEAFF